MQVDSSKEKLDGTQIQSQAVQMEDFTEQFDQTDNQLAQRSSSIMSDDVLFGDQEFEGKEQSGRDNTASEDLLELNTEEQEQFEVLDSAEGEDERSQG